MEERVLFQGAESKIYLKDYLGQSMLVKERFSKKYRNPTLDANLTKERIKAECRNMMRCKQAGIKTPAIYFIDMEKRLIFMEYIKDSITAKKLIDQLEADTSEAAEKSLKALAEAIGTSLGKMHAAGIVHGDLTTSNMLVEDQQDLTFIDFGLSSCNASAEDKGVDLYVLERALLSTHAQAQQLFADILESYKTASGKQVNQVMAKFEEVRARGRKRTMVG